MAAPLRLINDEERPDIACLMVHAGKALYAGLVFRNEEDRLIHVPANLLVGDESGICEAIL